MRSISRPPQGHHAALYLYASAMSMVTTRYSSILLILPIRQNHFGRLIIIKKSTLYLAPHYKCARQRDLYNCERKLQQCKTTMLCLFNGLAPYIFSLQQDIDATCLVLDSSVFASFHLLESLTPAFMKIFFPMLTLQLATIKVPSL